MFVNLLSLVARGLVHVSSHNYTNMMQLLLTQDLRTFAQMKEKYGGLQYVGTSLEVNNEIMLFKTFLVTTNPCVCRPRFFFFVDSGEV